MTIDEQIIEAMILQDEIDEANSVCADIESDELYKLQMKLLALKIEMIGERYVG